MTPLPATAFTRSLSIENIPQCLRQRHQWVCWRYIERDGKPTKCPFSARTGTAANSTGASTWSSFEEAVDAYQSSNRYEGVGFVFAADDPYCGIDLDDCIDPVSRGLKPWGQQFIDQLDSYSEISPSKRGVKVFVQGRKPGQRCKKAFEDGEVEMYDHDRFFTVTGCHLTGTPITVNARQDGVTDLYQQVFGEAPRTQATPNPPAAGSEHALSDDQIVEKASRSPRSGGKFAALWAGKWNEHFRSQSEADSSLVFTLAFYTKDANQIDRLFRRSGLMRDKWDENHGTRTYGEITTDNALQNVTSQYRPRHPTERRTAIPAGVQVADGGDTDMIPLGERDPETGRLVLSPKRTLPTALAFLGTFHAHGEGRTLHYYAEAFFAWRGNRFIELEPEALRQVLLPWLHDALRYRYNPLTEHAELVDFEANPTTVEAALASVRSMTHVPQAVTPPCWLDGGGGDDRPNPKFLLPFPTGTLDLSDVTGGNEDNDNGQFATASPPPVLAPTPALFNINAIDFAYEPNAPQPLRWLAFLGQLWGDDAESIELLQEWFGYALVGDTSQEKMLMIVGPRRSGKGTIGRVLTRLIGAGNVAGPTTASLTDRFGLQPLIGKSLAIVSDARFGGEHVGVLVERLLCISGEDNLSVDRKFKGSLQMKLPTRMVFFTNELPRVHDVSGALAGRFLILRLTHSFYGQENTGLTEELIAELPGILLWAIAGLRRLRRRGRFVQPQSGADAVQELEDLASPVGAFLRDRCELGTGRRAWADELYGAWRAWCEAEGRNGVTTKQVFGRDLAAVAPSVACRRHRTEGRFYEGISLRGVSAAVPADPATDGGAE